MHYDKRFSSMVLFLHFLALSGKSNPYRRDVLSSGQDELLERKE